MINKTIVETVMAQLPDNFTLGTLIDNILKEKEAQNWIVYYNPAIMKDDTTNCLYGVLMNKNNPILCVEDHINAIENKLYKDIMSELNCEDDEFDEDELHCLIEWAEDSLSNFHDYNVNTPEDFYNEIINCDNFYRLTSDLRDLWKDIDLETARVFITGKFRAKNEAHILSVESAISQGVGIFNEHLASIFADDDTDDNDDE